MKIRLMNADIKVLGDETEDPQLKETYRYGSSNKSTQLEIDDLRPATIERMISFFEGRNQPGGSGGVMNDANTAKKLRAYNELASKPDQIEIKDVHSIVTALTNYIGGSENFWLLSKQGYRPFTHRRSI